MSNASAAPLIHSRTDAPVLPTRAELHARIAPFERASSFQGYKSLVVDLALYAIGIAAVVLFDSVWGKIAGGILAGLSLVNLGSLSHEAAHRALVQSRLGNKVIAVVTLTMILFNYRLWIYDHHVLHHGRTNVKHNNFLSPLTLAEYRALSPFRRAVYRAYHSETGLGILLYFMLNRWPNVHFYPGAWLPPRFHASAWRYTALITAYMAALLSVLVLVPSALGGSVVASVICGFVVPYTIWFTTFSMTAFLQHTNPQLRWHRDVANMTSPPESTSVQVGIPQWMNYVTHYVLEHPVHHVSAMIPHYNLKRAQAALTDIVEPNIISMQFTVGNMRDVLRRCRIYDYDAHAWLDFEGQRTAVTLDIRKVRTPAAPQGEQMESPGIFFPADQAEKAAEPAAA
jgi:omega-6 fatty acid desaturase (delta-12 desaturase)